MRTKRVSLVYTITQKEVIPPEAEDLTRKDKFISEAQRSVESEYKPLQIKVTYELYNPEVDNLRRFFHTCVKYYIIQNENILTDVPTAMFKDYREEILDELLGYDYKTANKIIRKRESTSTYKDTQPWLTLLQNLEETLFHQAGFEFPDSKRFWELTEQYGYSRANKISLEQLQDRLSKKSV